MFNLNQLGVGKGGLSSPPVRFSILARRPGDAPRFSLRRQWLGHNFLDHFPQRRNFLFTRPHRYEAYISAPVDQKRHGNGKHAVVPIVDRRICDYETVWQSLLLLEGSQVSKFFAGGSALAVNIAEVVCETQYYQSLVFIAFMPALQSGKSVTAGPTPGRPKIEQDNLTAQVG